MKINRYLLSLATIAVLFLSCSKNDDDQDEETPKPLTKKEMLVKNSWRVDELFRSVSGYTEHYLRNGENNTGVNYGSLRLTFKADNTGTYVDEVGTSHTLIWSFTSSDQRNMQLQIGPPSAQTFIWNLVEITDDAVHSVSPSSNTLIAVRYTPVTDTIH